MMVEIHNVLNKMVEILQQLIEILHTEQMILLESNPAHKLSNIIDEKNQLLISLKILDEQRIAMGKQQKIESPYHDNPSLSCQWVTIVETTALLAQMNRENGAILQNRMDKAQQAIDFLNKLNNPNVYTNGGYQPTETVSTTRAKV